MAEQEKKISFGFSKSIKKPIAKDIIQEEKKVDYIECLDAKEIKVIGKEEKKEEPLVIPLRGSKTWYDRIINKINADIFESNVSPEEHEKTNSNIKQAINSKKPNGNATLDSRNVCSIVIKTEPVDITDQETSLEEQAAREIIQDLNITENKVNVSSTLALPVVENQSLRGAEEPTLHDYEQIPIETIGFAMLRGMGWTPEDDAHKNEKYATPVSRPKGMGLGADKVIMQKKKGNSIEKKEEEEEEIKLEKGTYVKIIVGRKSNNYGQIEGFDGETGRWIIKMALGGNTVSVNEFMVEPITKLEYNKKAKVLNATKYEEYKNKEAASRRISMSSVSSTTSTNSERDEEESIKLHDKTRQNKKSRKHKRYSSDSNPDRKSKKQRRSSSCERYQHKRTRKLKKQKKDNNSSEKLNRKHKKKDKQHEKAKDKQHEKTKDKSSKNSDTHDKKKYDRRRRSKSRSPKRRSRSSSRK